MKNKLRKMLSLVLAVVIAMSAISVNTLAATRMNIANGSNQKLYVDWYGYSYNFNGRLNTSTYGQIIKLNVGSSTGQVAYCIQSSKDAWTGDYTAQDYYDDLSRAQKLNLKHALIYGYQGTTNYGYNADTERIATQIVIWNICDGWFNNFAESTAVGIFTEGMSSSMATNVKACYNKIKEQMLSHTTIPSYAVGKKDTPTKQKMTTNSDGTFTITLTDSKNVSKYYDWQTAIKKYSYLSIITDTEGKLYVFESVIDMLSYASFYAINNGQDAWQQLTMLSLGGKSDVALDEFLKNKPIAEITFCLDNDDAGKHATEQLSDKYALKGYAVSKDIPLNKDFNDDLKAFRALNEKNTVQATKPLKR